MNNEKPTDLEWMLQSQKTNSTKWLYTQKIDGLDLSIDIDKLNKCSKCLDTQDVKSYTMSPLSNYMTVEQFDLIRHSKPFTTDKVSKTCKLNCQEHYHSN